MKSKSTFKKIGKLTLAAAAVALMSAPLARAIDAGDVLEAYVDGTVLSTYAQMSDYAIKFNAAVEELKKSPSDENALKAAKAWSDVRKYWEQSEAFLYGPAAFASLDPNLDSWPLDQAQLDTLIKSVNEGSVSIDGAYVRGGLGAAFRGFHAAEYLLFRDGAVRKSSEISKGELEYLAAVAQVIMEDSIALESWWKGSDKLSEAKSKILESAEVETMGSYASEMKNAGKSGSRYESQSEAIAEIFDGCIDIVDELVESKLGTPAKTENPLECESRHSGTSLVDARDNLISVRNSYEGLSSDKASLSGLVAEKSKEADEKVKSSLDKAIKSVEALKAPMFKNLKENKEGFKVAISACEELSEALDEAKELVCK